MARRGQRAARLPEGMTVIEFASPARIMAAFEGNEQAIRAEYSRQRSIIRKRIERMKAAKETYNATYAKFGDLKSALPSARGMSTMEMMKRMSGMASNIAGTFESTLSQIKQSRADVEANLIAGARSAGDTKFAEALEAGGLTPIKYERMKRVMGMIRAVMPDAYPETAWDTVQSEVAKTSNKKSLIDIAGNVLRKLGFEADTVTIGNKYTAQGKLNTVYRSEHMTRKR